MAIGIFLAELSKKNLLGGKFAPNQNRVKLDIKALTKKYIFYNRKIPFLLHNLVMFCSNFSSIAGLSD